MNWFFKWTHVKYALELFSYFYHGLKVTLYLHSDTFISICVMFKITVISVHDVWTLQICAAGHSKWHCCCTLQYTLSNKYQDTWNCLKSCSRSDVTYICHHNSSSLYFLHICAFVAFLCLSFVTFNHVAYILNQRHQHSNSALQRQTVLVWIPLSVFFFFLTFGYVLFSLTLH